ncbi:MerR family transcriptional regulator [Halieaceae bacterium IMCC14734]|uniref:MerR family transcriptional regulator n=2 Tax=Candidatus Litorirhabdus singularis TaxID=2518993 RepID=A0ABT3TBL9_9GAMM|nr:MerR family transcriptional regulator [Candidatus Litorirhabdus singularis]
MVRVHTMNAPVIDSRPLYGIGTVARLSRLKPDTLRIWERRYGLGASQKTESGRRLYTQTDLDHLQIVSRLVDNGFRIGEIATLERKTLAALADAEGVSQKHLDANGSRYRYLFAGETLCQWLDQHPGCLSRLDSLLMRAPMESLLENIDPSSSEIDALVLETPRLGSTQLQMLESLRQRFSTLSITVLCSNCSKNTTSHLADMDIRVVEEKLDTQRFASILRDIQCQLETAEGSADTGDLVSTQPILFDTAALQSIAVAPSHLECACSQHLANIIQALQEFEAYTRDCEVNNWNDAAAHSCIYAYTNQARWLMEKSLGIALEESKTASH